jgi:hypothetical protein
MYLRSVVIAYIIILYHIACTNRQQELWTSLRTSSDQTGRAVGFHVPGSIFCGVPCRSQDLHIKYQSERRQIGRIGRTLWQLTHIDTARSAHALRECRKPTFCALGPDAGAVFRSFGWKQSSMGKRSLWEGKLPMQCQAHLGHQKSWDPWMSHVRELLRL